MSRFREMADWELDILDIALLVYSHSKGRKSETELRMMARRLANEIEAVLRERRSVIGKD
jgi:hypothetical protein